MKTFLTLFLVCCSFCVFSQNIAINTDGSSPDPSAILELKSDVGGFLPPRMTTALRNAVASPAVGLLIYNIDTGCLNVYDGTYWRAYCPDVTFASSCPVGMVDFGYYSIEQNTHPVSGFFPAVVTCKNLGPRTRLCTAAEWYFACQSGLVALMGTNDEWVDDFLHENNALLIGGNSCDDTAVGYESNQYLFRCCCEH